MRLRLQHITLAAVGLLPCLPVSASEPDYLSYERPTPDSVLDESGTYGETAEGKPAWKRRLKRRATSLGAFFWDDATVLLQPRTYYLDKHRPGSADSEAWAAGGALQYRSGTFRDRLRLGATAYTSRKLYGPADKGGTLLLKPVQNSFSVLGEVYAEATLTPATDLRLYRQSLNLPYVNRQDNRMVPNSFEAYSLLDSRSPRLNYIVSQITRMKPRDATSFIHMSEAAGADNTDKGLTTLGARYLFSPHVDIGAINHHSWDVMNIFYAEANAARELAGGFAVRISAQYTSQKSMGDELIGDFDTGMYGTQLSFSYASAILTLARTSVDRDSGLRSPFGGYPGYTSILVEDFNRAGENAWLVGLSYDFARIGLDGLSAFSNYVRGDTPDSGSSASPDQKELDFTFDYRPGWRLLKGLWIRARAGFVNRHHAGDIDDYRIIMNYSIPLH
jgi:hypothetical protein